MSLMISPRARVWVNNDVLPCLWIVCMVFDTFRPVTRSVLSVRSHDIFCANVCLCLCVSFLFPLSHSCLKSAVMPSEYRTPISLFICVSQREREKFTQIVSPLPSPAAETLKRDWEHCAHMSHALVTAVGDGEMGGWSIRDGGVEQWKRWNNFTAVAAVEKPVTCFYPAAVLHSYCGSTPQIV